MESKKNDKDCSCNYELGGNITQNYSSPMIEQGMQGITSRFDLGGIAESAITQAYRASGSPMYSFGSGGAISQNRVYIDFLNKKKNFQKDRKYFNSHQEARDWALKNFERFDPDMIKTEYAEGGGVDDEYGKKAFMKGLKKGTIIKNYEVVGFEIDKSGGYESQNILLKKLNSDKVYSRPLEEVMLYSKNFFDYKDGIENGKFADGGEFAEGGGVDNITPALNKKVNKRAEEIYKIKNGKTKSDYDKAKDKAILEFGYSPSLYHKVMREIGPEFDDMGEYADSGEFAEGGDIAQSNYEMMLSQTKEVKHHVEELSGILKNEKEIEAWVVSKMETVAATLSDITHYLDGKTEYRNGGVASVTVENKDVNFDQDHYKGIFDDIDLDGIPNADDPEPQKPGNQTTIEQVQFTNVFDKVISTKKELDKELDTFLDKLRNYAPENSAIYARTKTPFSIFNKLVDTRLLDEKKGLKDLVGTTIAFDELEDLEKTNKLAKKGYFGKVIDFDDFYNNPNHGYRAYHYIIEQDGVPIELQLKTKRMKDVNVLSHDAYKQKNLNESYNDYITLLAHQADMGNQEAIDKFREIMRDKDKVKQKLFKNPDKKSQFIHS